MALRSPTDMGDTRAALLLAPVPYLHFLKLTSSWVPCLQTTRETAGWILQGGLCVLRAVSTASSQSTSLGCSESS